MVPSLKMSPVRSFTEDDIPQVADLHRSVFKLADRLSPEMLDSYRAYFDDVFFSNPWRDPAVAPLVYEDTSGKITGFMGVMPRRLSFNGKSVQMAVMSQFVVDPGSRGLPGLKLLSALFAGPQDLTVSDEASEVARGLWEGLGASTSLPHSMRWFYAVRPFQFATLVLKKLAGLPSFFVRAAAPAARAADALSARALKFPYHPVVPKLSGEEMSNELLLTCLSEMGGRKVLRPDYDEVSLAWTLRRATQLSRNGKFQKIVVKTADRKIAGWYLYYLNPGGVSQVLQLHARTHLESEVLDHLFYNAWSQGATVLSGRMELSRHFTQKFSDKHFLFHCGPEWMLFHARRPELISAFQRGDVCLSRLEGEWCTHFR